MAHISRYHTRKGQVRIKKEEARILTLLKKADIPFKEQHMIDFKCIGPNRDGDRAWIDFLVEIKDNDGKMVGFVFLEVDEHQHEWYSLRCENRRMMDVHASLVLEGNTFPVAFVRYNPNVFYIDGVRQKYQIKRRERDLLKLLRSFSFDLPFSVIYLFYEIGRAHV